jgi:hypothetical protein
MEFIKTVYNSCYSFIEILYRLEDKYDLDTRDDCKFIIFNNNTMKR